MQGVGSEGIIRENNKYQLLEQGEERPGIHSRHKLICILYTLQTLRNQKVSNKKCSLNSPPLEKQEISLKHRIL